MKRSSSLFLAILFPVVLTAPACDSDDDDGDDDDDDDDVVVADAAPVIDATPPVPDALSFDPTLCYPTASTARARISAARTVWMALGFTSPARARVPPPPNAATRRTSTEHNRCALR